MKIPQQLPWTPRGAIFTRTRTCPTCHGAGITLQREFIEIMNGWGGFRSVLRHCKRCNGHGIIDYGAHQ